MYTLLSGPMVYTLFPCFLRKMVSPGLLCNLERKLSQNMEKIGRFPGREKSVESCHVSGYHGFFGPDNGPSSLSKIPWKSAWL